MKGAPVLLIHGGLWDATDSELFWYRPGIMAGLEATGLTVEAPDRPRQPASWSQEVTEFGALLASGLLGPKPVTLVGASNGCTVAALLALECPTAIGRLLLAWPATGGDPEVNAWARAGLIERGATPEIADGLLFGETLRGVTDAQVASLELTGVLVGVLPSVPENPSHQRKTVDELLRLVPSAVELPGCPEPPRADFAPYRDQLVATLHEFAS
ncbi:alpha/beta fold hydrolase [Kribbella sp. CA-253562]|uniref:alpha/beta fold hydrolase n=1 Tax=Kribbella sp. CA-253562 TaxID=3239942 RepID=UPI003D8CF376